MKLSKLEEFASINDSDKFYYHSKLLFKDGRPVYNFWRHYKDEILVSDDHICKQIQEQFWLYDNKHLLEFANEENLNKFNDSKHELKFSDGTDMARWFRMPGLKERIFASKDKYSLKIQEDFNNYKRRKLIEFSEIEDLNKFYTGSNMLFSDGSSVNSWWILYKDNVLNSFDEYSIKIQEQYMDYKSRDFLDKLTEFLLMDDDLKFKNTTKDAVHFKDGSGVYSWYSHYRKNVKIMVNEMIKLYEEHNMVVPKCLLNKTYLDKETIKKYEL